MVLDKYFDAIFVISVKDRNSKALTDLFSELEKKNLSKKAIFQPGVRGWEIGKARWYRAGCFSWGCLLSHLHVLQRAHVESLDTCLVLEDDVVWRDDAADRVEHFMRNVPSDWEQIYLGGRHKSPPTQVNDLVYRASKILATHAYAVNRAGMKRIYRHVIDVYDYLHSGMFEAVDTQMARGHAKRLWNAYAPVTWIAGQGAGVSTITGRSWPVRWFDMKNEMLKKISKE